MILTLRMTANEHNAGEDVRTLEHGTLTIGRGAENDWVLSDPERTLSKQHCRIDRSDTGFLLTDLSTNGVFIGAETQPIGRGRSYALASGDIIVIGPFHIAANLSEDVDMPGLAPDPGLGAAPPPDLAQPQFTGVPQTPGSPISPPQEEPWLNQIPGGAFGPSLHVAPPGWNAPIDPANYGATGLRLSEAAPEPVPVAFSQESEHIAADATVMRLPATKVVLPTDWNDADPLEEAQFAAPSFTPPTPEIPVVAVPQWAPAANGSETRLLDAFLDGAGLSPDAMAGLPPEEACRELGRLVRAAVEGVRDILATRAMVKSELRIDQTVIQAAGNNTMKFAPDLQRCLTAMVGQPPAGFLPGAAAMRQSLDDIKLHDLALVAALNSVFAEMSAQFDPDAIAAKIRSESGLGAMLPYAKDARCWALYVEHYRALQSSGAENTAGSLLAPLALAYARQVRRGA